jgi:Tol biopolymer transport system component
MAVARFLLSDTGVADRSGASTAVSASPQNRLRTMLVIAAASLIGAAAASAVLWSLRPSAAASPVARFAVTLPQGQTFTGVSRQFVAISPDGTKVAYVANTRLYLRSISDLDARPIPGSESNSGLLNPVFSPDGGSIAFFSVDDNTIRRIAVAGGAAVTLCRTSSPLGMSWSDSGIVFAQARGNNFESTENEGRVLRVSANGGTPEQLITLDGEFPYGPQMLPDGEAVLFTLMKSTVPVSERVEKAEVVIQSLKDDKRTTLVNGSDGRYLTSGHLAYTVGGVIFAVSLDVRQPKVAGPPVPVLQGVRRSVFGTGVGAEGSGAGEVMRDPGTQREV